MRYRSALTLFLFVSLSIGFLGLQPASFVPVGVGAVDLPPMSLVLVGANGTEVVLNETAISGLPSYRGYGGFKNQLGILKGWGNYTGVSLATLCDLVGGLTSTGHLKVVAADDYSMDFTFAEVNGDFVTYDATGAEVPHSQPLVPTAAYYFNDMNISSSDGPLRLAIVGPEGLATDSVYWVKMVVRVEVIDEAIPEFPSLTILSALFLAILVAAICLKVWGQRRISRQTTWNGATR